ncbi:MULTISPECIES: DUF6332 family protein [unclassified Streptomyces]|uniref:DUF6332 family protein n=1 Tax=unclassified Streptomyces TaxID=2593676 RepID=UPI00136FDA19|nr:MULTISPECIES: DUF6332 family protein [unclassified Streptomyces]NEA03587.1 hypothetical protein [Streptomyces sp. SID10116]MYY82912.1 hypothetical protein [Streptomyces sp. SID335]MYZ12468.1 hypothetical protein [Streptomyces sp. SID337]NDZ86987.1 hypothetical protein [Streptomyces sp. SID10115]NEB45946.1 hypothetical protein [Streptomyces sp. SID339]
MGTSRRSQAERDAMTVEIGYALLSACFLGAVVFGAIAGPAAVWQFPSGAERVLVVTGAAAGIVLGVLRVVHVLWRYAGTPRPDPDPDPGSGSAD